MIMMIADAEAQKIWTQFSPLSMFTNHMHRQLIPFIVIVIFFVTIDSRWTCVRSKEMMTMLLVLIELSFMINNNAFESNCVMLCRDGKDLYASAVSWVI